MWVKTWTGQLVNLEKAETVSLEEYNNSPDANIRVIAFGVNALPLGVLFSGKKEGAARVLGVIASELSVGRKFLNLSNKADGTV